MNLVKKGKLEYYQFEKLKDLRHCFSTRLGGVSEGCYSTLNLGFRKDEITNVIENYRIICNAIGCDYRSTVWTRQVHEDKILDVTKEDCGKGLLKPRQIEGYDGIITNCPDVTLVGFSADCVLLYFYDPVKKVIAISHSGWRGTIKSIGAKTVKKMTDDYGCNKEDIICCISPAIAKCHFQVDDMVVNAFRDEFDWVGDYIETDKLNEGKYYMDLHGINEQILINAGIKKTNIENSRICTMCSPDKFYSHRLTGDERGSMAGFLSL